MIREGIDLSPLAAEREQRVADLERAIGYDFADRELLRVALIHRSYSNERGEDENYERLEFLGDSVLGLITAEWLFEERPTSPEGKLAKLKSFLVSAPVLSRHAESIGMGALVYLGVGEKRSGGQSKASILADVMESVLGAVYLDGGYDAARRVMRPILDAALESRSRLPQGDSKTALQELVQAQGWRLPKYRLAKESGPDHRKLFTVECWVEGDLAGSAEGSSKKVAEQAAAAQALRALDLLRGAP